MALVYISNTLINIHKINSMKSRSSGHMQNGMVSTSESCVSIKTSKNDQFFSEPWNLNKGLQQSKNVKNKPNKKINQTKNNKKTCCFFPTRLNPS